MLRNGVSWTLPVRIVTADSMKTDDWLASTVDLDVLEDPKTSVATSIEVQYVMEDVWDRDRQSRVHREIADEGIALVPLTADELQAAGELRRTHDRLNVFDGVHLGQR